MPKSSTSSNFQTIKNTQKLSFNQEQEQRLSAKVQINLPHHLEEFRHKTLNHIFLLQYYGKKVSSTINNLNILFGLMKKGSIWDLDLLQSFLWCCLFCCNLSHSLTFFSLFRAVFFVHLWANQPRAAQKRQERIQFQIYVISP